MPTCGEGFVATAIAPDRVASQLRELGVRPGGVLLVHTSYRAVGPVEGGALGLIDALRAALGPEGTLVMPSWGGRDTVPFDPARSPPSADLGILPRLFWRMPETLRSDHVHAFAAAGPRAGEVLRDTLPLPPHRPESPVGRVRDLDGQVLLLGVNHDADTTIHLAEVTAGVRYGRMKYVTVLEEGRMKRIDYLENDHCCERFVLVDGWLREAEVQREGPVGYGVGRLARARDIVDEVVDRLRSDPLVFLHTTDVGCVQCDEARSAMGDPRREEPPVQGRRL